MKKLFLNLFFLIFVCQIVSSQSNCVKVIYKIQRSISTKTNTSPDHTKIKESINIHVNNLECVLYCNSLESLFYLEKKMEFEDDLYYRMAIIIGGEGFYYKKYK